MRQFVSAEEPENGMIRVRGKDFRYLRSVLRLKAGDMLSVRTPSGALLATTVAGIDDDARKITLSVCSTIGDGADCANGENIPAERLKEITLFMFVPKPSKFEQIVRQACECGVARIVPVASEFSQKGAERMDFKGERFARILKEARQQSGSAVETVVEKCVSFDGAISMWRKMRGDGSVAFVMYERSEFTVPMADAVAGKYVGKAALFVGAEGGISPREIDALRNEGVIPVHFRTNILRCETAAIYGIAVMQNLIEGM